MIQIAQGLQVLHKTGCYSSNSNTQRILLYGASSSSILQKIDIQGSPDTNMDHQMSVMSQEDILMQPPEYFSDHAHNNESDVWQLGILFYEIITFNRLFSAQVQQLLMSQMAEVDIAFEIDQIPEAFALFKDIIKQMLGVDACSRCTLDCVIEQLAAVQGQLNNIPDEYINV